MGSKNGCGVKRWGIMWRPPCSQLFKNACDTHDLGYDLGGEEEDRIMVDKEFLQEMCNIVEDTYPKWRRWYYYGWCKLYYKFVRVFGGRFFSYDS